MSDAVQIVYGWERRRGDGSYELIPSTLSAYKSEAEQRAICDVGTYLWAGDNRSQFSSQWNSGQIRPARFELIRKSGRT